MVPDENISLLEAARAIVAGRRVDWAAIESGSGISESLASLLRELKVVEDIAELHRTLPEATGRSGPSVSSAADAVSATAASIDATATWGSLRLLERVGQGAFGDVYRAWDPRLDREVALKLLKKPDSRQDSVGAIVIDEGRLLAKVRHPNVVTVYGADRIDGRVGLWMEFVRGRTIEAVLRDHGTFGAEEAALIGLDLCRALSAVHRAGLIHRDIKAQNVVREAGGRIVLMDFGTGREELDGRPAELAGTPLYLAPEVFDGAATARSDIYSVGVVLYHLVTGSYPVKGRTVAELRHAHGQKRRSWLRDERPDLSDTFVQSVERALEDDPDRRYESAGAMEAALASVVSRSGTPSYAVEPEVAVVAPRAAQKTAAPRIVRLAAWFALAAAGLAGAVVVSVPAWRDRILGRPVPPSPMARSVAGPASSSLVMRRIPLEDFSFIGSPSRDGSLFSVADTNGNVAVLDLATGQLRRVTNDATFSAQASQFAHATAISPDSRFVAYGWSALDGQFEIRVIDLDGTRPRVLLRSASIEYAAPIEWSRDGKSILVTQARSDHSTQLALVSIDDGAVRIVKDMSAVGPQYASISPDGEFVVYDAPQRESAAARDIFIERSDGSEERRLVGHDANDAQPVWTPDGRAVLFTSDRSGTNDVWSIAVDRGFASGEPELLHRNVGRMWLRGLTHTGSYFYYLTAGVVDVYEAPLSGDGVGKRVLMPKSYAGSNISSIWSPDGQRLAYASRRGTSWFDRGTTTLAIRDLRTNAQRELAPALNGFLLRAWSPDGRYVLVGGTGVDQRQGAYRIDADNAGVTSFVDNLGVRPDWRPDGRIVYFNRLKQKIIARDLSTGAEAIVFDPRAEGAGEIVAHLYGRGYRLSPDGQTLAVTTSAGQGEAATVSLSIKVLGGGPARELVRVPGPDLMIFQDWSPDGAAVLFTRWSPKTTEPVSLWRVSIHGGDPQPLGLSMIGLRDVSMHPDGTKITFTAGWPVNEVWAMDNFLTTK
jgi:Tol biopolymer transport system component